LGWLYANGEGVLQDFLRAHMWFNIGSALGSQSALSGRDFVAKQMTAQQIADAQKMARECTDQIFKEIDS
jgi:TPR repeat protein